MSISESPSGKILIETHDRVVLLRLNTPTTMNSFSPDMAAEMMALVNSLQNTARAIVLAGSERAFCSGAALNEGKADPNGVDAGKSLESHYNPLFLALRGLNIPLVTAVRGAAAGVGASLALVGDLIVAGKSAYFLQAFGRIGLVPDGGSPWLLARSAGRARAMEMILLAEKLPAEKAYEWGMVTRVVEDAQVEVEALALAHRLAKGPRLAIAHARQLVWSATENSFAEELVLERRLQRECGLNPDFAEGVKAFLEKRPAAFAP